MCSKGPPQPSQDAAADLSSTGGRRVPTTNQEAGEWGKGWDTVNREYLVVKIFLDSLACAKIKRMKIYAQY